MVQVQQLTTSFVLILLCLLEKKKVLFFTLATAGKKIKLVREYLFTLQILTSTDKTIEILL